MPDSMMSSGITGTREKIVNGEKKTVFNYKVKGSIDPAMIADGSDKIIEAVTKKYQDKIDTKTKKISALQEVETTLQTIGKKLLALRGEPYLKGFENKNIFLERHLGVQNKDVTDSKIYMDCICAPATPVRHFKMSIRSLAEQDQTVALGNNYPQTVKAPLNLQGTLTVNGVDVKIQPDMSLKEIQMALSSASSPGKFHVFVDALKPETETDPGVYRLYLQGREEGQPLTLSENSGSNVLAGLNLAQSGKTKDALSAKIIFNGQEVTRSTNKIADLVDGYTFNLFGVTPGSEPNYLILKTEKDLAKIRDAVVELVNAIKSFYDLENKYCARDPQGRALEESFLANDPTMGKIIKELDHFLRQAVPGIQQGNVKIGAELGFSLQRETNATHKFFFDEAKFVKILMESPEKIEDFFSWKVQWQKPYFYLGSSGTSLNGLLKGKPIQLKIWREGEGPEGLKAAFKTASSNWVDASVSHTSIRGAKGSIYEPFFIAIFEEGARQVRDIGSTLTTEFTVTQGKADELMGTFFPRVVGSLATIAREQRIEKAIDQIEKENKQITSKMNREIDHLQNKKEKMMGRIQKLNEVAQKFERAKEYRKSLDDFFKNDK